MWKSKKENELIIRTRVIKESIIEKSEGMVNVFTRQESHLSCVITVLVIFLNTLHTMILKEASILLVPHHNWNLVVSTEMMLVVWVRQHSSYSMGASHSSRTLHVLWCQPGCFNLVTYSSALQVTKLSKHQSLTDSFLC